MATRSSPTGGAFPSSRKILPNIFALRTSGDVRRKSFFCRRLRWGNCGASLRLCWACLATSRPGPFLGCERGVNQHGLARTTPNRRNLPNRFSPRREEDWRKGRRANLLLSIYCHTPEAWTGVRQMFAAYANRRVAGRIEVLGVRPSMPRPTMTYVRGKHDVRHKEIDV